MESGTRLADRYEILDAIGQGGMGSVFRALRLADNRVVAIKQLIVEDEDETLHVEALLKQCRKEAEWLRQITHPCLPEVYDYFEAGQTSFIVMEYIEGRTLSSVALDCGPQAEDQVRGWIKQIAEVLKALHSLTPPIIHRDLKPGNVMVQRDGRIKLIDFGIAKEYDVETGGGTRTVVRGAASHGFAAPEQYGAGTDQRTDVYALGALAYYMLTGIVPPPSISVACGQAQVVSLESVRPDVSPTMVDGVKLLMELRSSKRPGTMDEAMKALALDGPMENYPLRPPPEAHGQTPAIDAAFAPTVLVSAPPTVLVSAPPTVLAGAARVAQAEEEPETAQQHLGSSDTGKLMQPQAAATRQIEGIESLEDIKKAAAEPKTTRVTYSDPDTGKLPKPDGPTVRPTQPTSNEPKSPPVVAVMTVEPTQDAPPLWPWIAIALVLGLLAAWFALRGRALDADYRELAAVCGPRSSSASENGCRATSSDATTITPKNIAIW